MQLRHVETTRRLVPDDDTFHAFWDDGERRRFGDHFLIVARSHGSALEEWQTANR